MPRELKLRRIDDETYARLRRRAQANGRSIEGELRLILSEALTTDGAAVTPDEWKSNGFQEVHEIVPGRHYEVWAQDRRFRIMITKTILGPPIRWNSKIDECLSVRRGNEPVYVWASPFDIAARLLGDTPKIALIDAMNSLADFARLNPEI